MLGNINNIVIVQNNIVRHKHMVITYKTWLYHYTLA